MKRALAIILSIVLVLAITFPAAALSIISVKSIKLNNSKITLKVGQTSNLKATFTPANTTQKSLTYVTGNKKIATVSNAGKITAVGAGTTTITVYTLNKKVFAKCNVTISKLVKLSGKITFVTNFSNKIETTIKALVQEFLNKNPGTQIDLQIAGDDYGSKMKIWMASNEVPDCAMVLPDTKNSDLPNYFLPLDDLGFTKDNLLFYNAGLGPDGKLYKIDSIVSYWAVVYNKKVFADCGITSVPKTVDELYAACEKIKQKGIVPLASNFKDKWPFGVFEFYPQAVTGNGNYLNDKVNSDEFLTDDGLLAGLKIMKTMKDKGYLEKDLMSTNWAGFIKDMAQGKFAMAYLATWFPSQLTDNGAKAGDVGMIPFPGTKGPTVSSDWFHAVGKDSKNPELAKAFLKYAWEDSRYQKATGNISPVKGGKTSDPVLTELLSIGAPVEMAAKADNYNALFTKAQIEYGSIFQEYLIAENPDDVVKKYNKQWAEARKSLGK